MKVSKLLVLGAIALLLAGGLALVGCEESCHGEKECVVTGKNTIWGYQYESCKYGSCAVHQEIMDNGGSDDYAMAWCNCK